LSGTIPSTIGSLTALQTLDLDHNQLSGTIPSTIGSLTALQTLDLDTNQLSGKIPTTFGLLTALENLNLNYNDQLGLCFPKLNNLLSCELPTISSGCNCTPSYCWSPCYVTEQPDVNDNVPAIQDNSKTLLFIIILDKEPNLEGIISLKNHIQSILFKKVTMNLTIVIDLYKCFSTVELATLSFEELERYPNCTLIDTTLKRQSLSQNIVYVSFLYQPPSTTGVSSTESDLESKLLNTLQSNSTEINSIITQDLGSQSTKTLFNYNNQDVSLGDHLFVPLVFGLVQLVLVLI